MHCPRRQLLLATSFVFLVGCEGTSTPQSAPNGPNPPVQRTTGNGEQGSSNSLQSAYDRLSKSAKQVNEIVKSVTDPGSAEAARKPLSAAGTELSAALTNVKTTVAALDLAGKKAEITQFLQERASKNESLEDVQLLDNIERLVNSSQGPLLRTEINALLDGFLEGSTSGG